MKQLFNIYFNQKCLLISKSRFPKDRVTLTAL